MSETFYIEVESGVFKELTRTELLELMVNKQNSMVAMLREISRIGGSAEAERFEQEVQERL